MLCPLLLLLHPIMILLVESAPSTASDPSLATPQVVTTLTTVGFGDVVAQTMLGRAVIITTICFGVVAIPVQASACAEMQVTQSQRGPGGYLQPNVAAAPVQWLLLPPCLLPSLRQLTPCSARSLVCRRHSCMQSSRRGGWCVVRA